MSLHRFPHACRMPARWAARGALLLLALQLSAGLWSAPAWSGNLTRRGGDAVEFELTPRGVKNGSFRVDVSVNTHSGDLAALNLQEATELRVADKRYRPVKPVALQGHHARGRLEFPLDQAPDAFEIVIRGVPSQGDLTFRWP
jgi:hypothetical protein